MAAGLTSGLGCGANKNHQINSSNVIFSAMRTNSSKVRRRNGRTGVAVVVDGLGSAERGMRRISHGDDKSAYAGIMLRRWVNVAGASDQAIHVAAT